MWKNEPVRLKAWGLFPFALLLALTFFDGGPETGVQVMRVPSSTTSPSAGRFRVAACSSAVSTMATPETESDVDFRALPVAANCVFKTWLVGRGAGRWGGLGSALWDFFAFFFPVTGCSSSLAGGAGSLLRFWPRILELDSTRTGVVDLPDDVFDIGWWGLLATAPTGLLATGVFEFDGMTFLPPIKWR